MLPNGRSLLSDQRACYCLGPGPHHPECPSAAAARRSEPAAPADHWGDINLANFAGEVPRPLGEVLDRPAAPAAPAEPDPPVPSGGPDR